jgi:predicted DCC family thiol-disulfide oxidoreductase YuxK
MPTTTAKSGSQTEGVWFAYDGDCPICNTAAHTLRIRQAVGELHLVNARVERGHPLVMEINRRNIDLDEGMVIKYRDVFYHGRDALHFMALFGSNSGWFNRTNAILFKSKTLARLCYPGMRGVRNLLLRLKGVPKIRNLMRD